MQEFSEALADARFPGDESGAFRVNGAVEVDDFPLILLECFQDGLQQLSGVGVQEGGTGIWKPFTDITKTCCSEECIDDGMDQDIGIAVTIEAKGGIFDQDTAEQEWSAGDGAVGVVSFADSECDWLHGGRGPGFSVRRGGGGRVNMGKDNAAGPL